MASQVGQGYNPEVSLLQGGTAPILPVQGGGGDGGASLPTGYNPDTSLLNTGVQAQILAIRGGGPVPEADTLPSPSTFVPLNNAPNAPNAEELPSPSATKKNVKKNSFEAVAAAVKAKEKIIELDANEYKLRIPFEKGVKEDWLAGKFTKEEVEFLKALQFTPTILADTFGKNAWKTRLVDFLEKIHVSNCFQDTTLLTNMECSTAQQFVKQVYLQIYNRMLEDIYDHIGQVKPSKLVDVLFRLKELGDTGMLNETVLSKYDYTGDLLNRFQTIKRDSTTGEYFFDFAEMTEATRDILSKMKLYRADDTDVEEVTRVLLERMGIPVPPRNTGAPAAQTGGEEEVFDLGEPINKKRAYKKETLRKKQVKRKTRKQNHKRK